VTTPELQRQFLTIFVDKLDYYWQNYRPFVGIIHNYHMALNVQLPEELARLLADSGDDQARVEWENLIPRRRSPCQLSDPLLNCIFNCVVKFALKYMWFLRVFTGFMNFTQRSIEARHAYILSLATRRECHSHRVGSFAFPDSPNLAIFPSPSKLRPTVRPVRATIFKVESEEFMLSDNDPPDLYRFSGSLPSERTTWQLFSEVFSVTDPGENCILVRQNIKVDSVVFKHKNRIRILTYAKMDTDSLVLTQLPQNAETSCPLKDAFLDGTLGPFSMFCGHFMLTFWESDVHQIFRYVYAACPNAVELFTFSSGSMVLCFSKPSLLFKGSARQLPPNATQQWQEGKLSNLEYLFLVNGCGNRSFNDLSSYPVAPRVVLDWATQECPRRNVATPMELVADRDSNHTQIRNRFKATHCHHKDGVSNPLGVSCFLARLVPFCHAYWETHQGWDRGGRDFAAISVGLTVNSLTLHELPPELFILPECLANLNRLVVDTTSKSFDIGLPEWCHDIHHFMEIHRSFLESPEIRRDLGRWIDHLFGVTRAGKAGEDILNIFPQTLYPDVLQKEPNEMLLECGQVPMQVFATAHPDPRQADEFSVQDIVVQAANRPAIEHCTFSRRRMSVSIGQMAFNGRMLAFTRHVNCGQLFYAVTTDISLVFVFHMTMSQPRAKIVIELPQFSVLFERQMLCYSVSLSKVTIWCFANSQIINVIDLDQVSLLEVNQERGTVFLTRGPEIYQMSVSGMVLRKFDIGETVSALAVCGHSFWFSQVTAIVGTNAGNVAFIGVRPEDHEFVEARAKERASQKAVRKIELANNDRTVVVYGL
jgi:hypothetical protein